MRLLCFLLLIAVSVYSACDDVKERFFFRSFKNWRDIHEVYKVEPAQSVSVTGKYLSQYEKEVTIQRHEGAERWVIVVNFEENLEGEWRTSVSYHGVNGENARALITSFYTKDLHETEPGCGTGCVFMGLPDGLACWRPATPHPGFAKRPVMHGFINGDANHTDITQYVFCCRDAEKGHFIRMRVQHNNLEQMKIFKGQERYGGQHMYDDDAGMHVFGEQIVKFKLDL